MLKCPKCGDEIRYIAGAPSSGGLPIAVDMKEEYLINDSGRRIKGYKEHICMVEAKEGKEAKP
jgi:hypothetical protein